MRVNVINDNKFLYRAPLFQSIGAKIYNIFNQKPLVSNFFMVKYIYGGNMDKVIDFIKKYAKIIFDFIKKIILKIISFIKLLFGKIISFIKSIINKIREFLKNRKENKRF